LGKRIEFNIPLQPKQETLLDLMENGSAEVIAFGGARGGSKSHGVRAVNLVRRLRYDKTESLVFRRTFPELRRNHILPTFRDWPQLHDWYNAEEHAIVFPNGSRTNYVAADDERALARLQGAEFADEFVDEATHNEEERIVWLRTMLRCTTNRHIIPRQVLTMNPGGVSHAFIKRAFIDKVYRGNERASDYAFLQAHGHDNVEWSRPQLERDGVSVEEYYSWSEEKRFDYFIRESQYGRGLDALPGRLRDANLLGRWDVFEGQYFDLFDEESNTVELEDAQKEMQPWHPRWISGDWGFNDDCVIHWHTVNERGLFTTYRELTLDHMTPDKLGQAIVQANMGDAIKLFAFSPDAFAKRQSVRTIADEAGDVLRASGLPFPTHADNDRIGGWQLMYQMLAARTWRITRNCRTLIESIPLLQQDDLHVNDVAESKVDHAPDSARYGLKTWIASPREPAFIKADRMVTAIDPTARAIQNIKAEQYLERANRPKRFARKRFY
jgi:phage terminase large subunit